MRPFYKKFILFALLLILFWLGLDYLSMNDPWRMVFARLTNSDELISLNAGTDEIIPYINKVRSQDNTTVLILGDSVCHQMFQGLQEYNENICIAGSNAAISMTGQYILAEEYIKNHPDATGIYLFILPTSLCNTFDTQWGYQYTVMPFVATDTLKLLDQDTINIMETVYGSCFLNPQMVQLIDKSAVNRKLYLNLLQKYRTGYTPKTTFEIADQYIRKIYELCQKNNIEFHMCSCPVSDSQFQYVEDLKASYSTTWMATCFPDYFNTILTFPDEQTQDGIHFAGEYETQEHYNDKISKILANSGLSDVLTMNLNPE